MTYSPDNIGFFTAHMSSGVLHVSLRFFQHLHSQNSSNFQSFGQRWDLSARNRNTQVTCFKVFQPTMIFWNNPPAFADDFEDSGAKSRLSRFWDWRFWHFDFEGPLFVTHAELLQGNAKPPPLLFTHVSVIFHVPFSTSQKMTPTPWNKTNSFHL